MKKKFVLIALVSVSLLVMFSSSAVAGWSDWYNSTVSQNGSHTTHFIPVATGTHKIEFLNNQSVYNGGWMTSYWGSSNNIGVWTEFSESDVLNYTRSQNLYAGSDDIIFKFVFTNITTGPVTFFYRFYTD